MNTHRLLSIGLALAILMSTGSIYAFRQPLPNRERLLYKEMIQEQAVASLRNDWNRTQQIDKRLILLDELGRRHGEDAKRLLEDALAEAMQVLRSTYGEDPDATMQRAAALVNLARFNSHGSSEQYLAALDALASSGDSFTKDAVALELGSIGSPQAKLILVKYENLPSSRPAFRKERLALDHRYMTGKDFLQSILAIAHDRALAGDTRLVAERTLLTEKVMQEPLPLHLLDEQIESASWSEGYRQFLIQERDRLRTLQDRLYPGYLHVTDLYKKKIHEARTVLSGIFSDSTQSTPYREFAYRLYLELEVENAGFSEQEAIQYLLGELTGLGEGRSSDWMKDKPGVKMQEAVKNAAVVRTLVGYGAKALFSLKKAVENASPDKGSERYEALTHVLMALEDGAPGNENTVE